MKQFVLPVDCPEQLELTGQDYHYLVTVRRLKAGDAIAGIDAQGTRYHAVVEAVRADSLRLQVLPAGEAAPQLPAVHLYQCVPKAGKFDQVVRMAVEAGVASITPVLSERTIPRYDARDGVRKQERWQRVALEAVQQSGSERVPQVQVPRSLQSLTSDEFSDTRMIFFHQSPLAPVTLHEYCSEALPAYGICVGPEGGFAPAEVERMQAVGWLPGYLGPWVLRTEHAGMYAIAAIHTLLLEKSNWKINTE